MTATTWTMRLARMLGADLAAVAHTQSREHLAGDIDGGIGDAVAAVIATLPPGPRRDLEGRELGPARGDLISYLTVRSKYDKETRRPGQRHARTWSEIASMLTTHTVLSHKDQALGFVPLTMADTPCTCGDEKCPGELGHLTESNVLAFNMLMLDLDKYRADDRQLDQTGAERAMARLRELRLRHCVYSTFSHRLPDRASLRAGIAVSRPVTVEEWPLFFPAVTSWLDIEHDPKCSGTVGRFWYLPAHPRGAEAIAYAVDGDPVNVDMIMAIARATAASTAKPTEQPRPAERKYTSRGDEFDIRELIATEYPDARTRPGGGNIAEKVHIGGARCPWSAEHTSENHLTDTTILIFTSGAWEFECQHSHCRHRNHEDFRKHHQPDWEPYDPNTPPRSSRASPDQAVPSEEHPNAPHVNGNGAQHASDIVEVELLAYERQTRRERAGEAPPSDDPPPAPPPDSHAAREAPPPISPADAVGDLGPAAPWGGKGPAAAAADYVRRFASHPDGPTLRKWKGDFYRWKLDLGSYAQVTDDQVDAELHRKLQLSRPADARDTRAALIAVDDVLIDDAEIGSWIGAPTVDHPALELAPCRNGLLHLPTGKLHSATPRYFAVSPLGTSFDRQAPRPERWLEFLKQLWPADQESIDALQEWIGYLLTPDTRQHKVLLLIGPKRSGKGTIARVMTALLGGSGSVAAPTLSQLGTNFGLAPCIGKTAAIIGDARLGGRTDVAQVVERLLNLSGEDAQTIDRKHRSAWTGKLSTRFTIISNELPKFTDASDALAGRMVILELTESFYGKEDIGLTDALLAELPGILRWAVEGWNRLRQRGHFVQPASSAALVDELEDLASPIKAWVRERCTRGPYPGHSVGCTEAFDDFKRWCQEENHKHVTTSKRFGTDLRTAAQVQRKQATGGGWEYRGIALNPRPPHWDKPAGGVPPPGDMDAPLRRDVYS